MLDYGQLEKIIDVVTQKITLANRQGTLDELLSSWGMSDLLQHETVYETRKDGKIVVIGESEVKEKILIGVINSLGIDKSRFEFCLDYDEAKTYEYRKLQYNPNYRVVMFGPVPHSSTGKRDSSSVIAEMKNNEGYPKTIVLSSNNAVKITKSNFKIALQGLLDENYI